MSSVVIIFVHADLRRCEATAEKVSRHLQLYRAPQYAPDSNNGNDGSTRNSKISTRILKCYVFILLQKEGMIAAVIVIVQHT